MGFSEYFDRVDRVLYPEITLVYSRFNTRGTPKQLFIALRSKIGKVFIWFGFADLETAKIAKMLTAL
jgi:hypothetical protein